MNTSVIESMCCYCGAWHQGMCETALRALQATKGWECPRCQRVNGPQVRQCDCMPFGTSYG